DFFGLMEAFRKNPLSEAYFGDIFGKRHAVKMMATLNGDLFKTIEMFNAEMDGAADRMSAGRMQGIVGQWNRLTAAVEGFYQAIGRTGIVGEVGALFETISAGTQDLSEMNPELLKLGAYGAVALAVLAPL